MVSSQISSDEATHQLNLLPPLCQEGHSPQYARLLSGLWNDRSNGLLLGRLRTHGFGLTGDRRLTFSNHSGSSIPSPSSRTIPVRLGCVRRSPPRCLANLDWYSTGDELMDLLEMVFCDLFIGKIQQAHGNGDKGGWIPCQESVHGLSTLDVGQRTGDISMSPLSAPIRAFFTLGDTAERQWP